MYRKFRWKYNTENYVKFNHNKYQRSLTAQLCMGILPLAIETEWYTKIPINQRMCFHCKDKVEDEFHFVCHCKLYEKEHLTLYPMKINLLKLWVQIVGIFTHTKKNLGK